MTFEQAPWIVGAIVTLLGGNLGRYAWKAFADWRKVRGEAATPVEAQQAAIDASILTVSRARDELEADNDRLRTILEEARRERTASEARYQAEIERYRAEIALLEARIVRERSESDARYATLLEQVQTLRNHDATTAGEQGR